jgi:hypothetical protein
MSTVIENFLCPGFPQQSRLDRCRFILDGAFPVLILGIKNYKFAHKSFLKTAFGAYQ